MAKTSTLSNRVQQLRNSLLETSPRLSCERLESLKEAYEETEGQPPVVRRARVFHKLLNQMTLFIDDNPIVGTATQYRGGIQPFPESSCRWMARETEAQTSLGKTQLADKDIALLDESVKYWRDRCALSMAKEIYSRNNGKVNRDTMIHAGVWIDSPSHPLWTMRVCVDYGKVLNKGLEGVIAEAEEELKKLPMFLLESAHKRAFLTSAITSCQAVIDFARRYSALARDMAAEEKNPGRRRELEQIAKICEQVPARPARSFREAIQSFWFIHLATHLEATSDGHSPGRFSQYMYPFYKQDKENGIISEEEALELLQLLFIKFTEIGMFAPRRQFEEQMGSMFQNISLGGINTDGSDATNDIDYLMVEAQRRIRMVQPTLSVLYHDKMPEDFLLKCAELIATGLGMPAFFNNDLNIQRLVHHGASLEDARNHCIIGCVESGFSHAAGPMSGWFINMPKILELALNDGMDPLTGQQLGPHTGRASEFRKYEDLNEAVRTQLRYFIPPLSEFEYTGHAMQAEHFPSTFASALVDDCIKRGTDMNSGGARYSANGNGPVGMIDMADSLVAIRKLVFEDQATTMEELLNALKANFEGHEELHRKLLDAPKFGNDDDYADDIAREWYRIFWEADREMPLDALGRETIPFTLSITTHFPCGVRVGALPSGRKAGVPLADASVSPEPGKDINGPTALIRSATRVLDTVVYDSGQLNMKFHPSSLKDKPGLRKLLAVIKTYLDLGGHHIQFNVIGVETLKDAQLHPENYKDLIVRVAGFSAFFIHLDPTVQEEIIKRTEIKL